MTTPEQTALRGLLLLVVEVQNVAQHVDALDAAKEINALVTSDHAREMVALARASLETDGPKAIPAEQASTHA